jgi:hypothetical protein
VGFFIDLFLLAKIHTDTVDTVEDTTPRIQLKIPKDTVEDTTPRILLKISKVTVEDTTPRILLDI